MRVTYCNLTYHSQSYSINPNFDQKLTISKNPHITSPHFQNDLQFQLEHLLADNLDWQKNIYGEMTFLSTGDYPTDDLRSRPMPSFELRSDSNGAHHQMDPDEPQ